LGSHSDGHPDMPSLPLEEVWEDTASLHNMLVEQFDYQPKLYRFPAGAFNEQTLALLQKAGYRSVFWSFAYKDWVVDDQPDPQQALEKILNSAHPGGIYLLHTVSETNANIIGDVIEGFEAKGFEIGDPTDLLE
jgi:peptidoglycan-N-acetylmuramic acid deacetylase